jgi:hypothetical protein
MPGIVAALVAHDPLDASTEQIGGFPLALVAPPSADEHDCRHGISPAYCDAAGEPPYLTSPPSVRIERQPPELSPGAGLGSRAPGWREIE